MEKIHHDQKSVNLRKDLIRYVGHHSIGFASQVSRVEKTTICRFETLECHQQDMGVSINWGYPPKIDGLYGENPVAMDDVTPRSSILMVFSTKKTIHFKGYPYFRKPPY